MDLMSMWTAYVINYFVFALASLAAAGMLLTASATTFRPLIMFFLVIAALSVGEYLITGEESMVVRFLFIEAPFISTSMFGYGLDDTMSMNTDSFGIMVQQAQWTLSHPSFWFSVFIGVLMVIAAINVRKYRAES